MKKLLVLFLFVFIVGCQQNNTEQEEILIPVETTQVEKNNIENILYYSGNTKPVNSVNVVPLVQGEVLDTFFEVGDEVFEQEILFKIDEDSILDQIRQLQAQLKQANSNVSIASNAQNNVSGGAYQSQIVQMETGISNTQNQLSLLEETLNLQHTNFENAKALYNNGVISKTEFESAELGYNQAKTNYDSTLQSLEQQETSLYLTSNEILRENQVTSGLSLQQATAARDAINVQIDIANKTLEDATIKAPISGIISYKGVNKNELTSPSTLAYTIVNMDDIIVNVKVSENIINKINKNDTISVEIDGKKYNGEISTISPVADQTNTYPVEIQISNNDHEIKPGMFANVSFVFESKENIISIPSSAIISSLGEDYVYIEENGVAKKVLVTKGITDGINVEILNGLNVNDNLIVKGNTYVADGEKINVVNK